MPRVRTLRAAERQARMAQEALEWALTDETVPMPALGDALLGGQGTEEQRVDIIRRHLRTPEQRAALAEADVTIDDMLNGRYPGEHEALVLAIFTDWNRRIGRYCFTAEGRLLGMPFGA